MPRFGFLNFAVVVFLLFDLILGAFWYINSPFSFAKKSYREARELSGNESFQELKAYFTKLAQEKGAAYAYEVLKIAHIKPGTDMHLMGHYVGEILYKQKGVEGMKYCTQDFRNACSHTIVVGLFSEKGVQAIPEIVRACEKAPGGRGAYNMCFHGLGHGVLAYTGYDLPKTVEICSKTKTGGSGREFPECVGGSVMEIIGGGDHDKALWVKQSEKYLSEKDPLYPCTASFMPDEVRVQCYVYLTPHLFIKAGGTLRDPASSFEKAFTFCNALTDKRYRDACYGGFGKEFVVLARARDIRNIAGMTTEELKTVYNWCTLSDSEDGKYSCLTHSVSSLYWGGENSFNAALTFCSLPPNKEEQDKCFESLVSMVFYYEKDKNKLKDFCGHLPQNQKAGCKDKT